MKLPTECLPGENGLTPECISRFQRVIYSYYQEHARSFPWRMTHDPYHILVSEIMLQQTQTERVAQKYEQFIATFPDFASLASAPLHQVLSLWQGLGYNRRAMSLKSAARMVMEEFGGNLPSDVELLVTLPGIGRPTASAIAAFAFNKPAVFIETNIRRVFIHFFFTHRDKVKDAEILPLVAQTLDPSNPRQWYYALMDYGVKLKKELRNPNRKSAHYQLQSPFAGSNRQVRGKILKILLARPNLSESEIMQEVNMNPRKVKTSLDQLQQEGFICQENGRFSIR
ncbi:MAG: winged helix-turn-helix transcriptional regulator [bacterium]